MDMRKVILYLLMMSLWGCASLTGKGPSGPGLADGEAREAAPETEVTSLQPALEKSGEDEAVPVGTIFGKTIFEGVVKTSYVRFTIVDQSDPAKTYQLYIGDKARQKSFPWKTQTVKPGYFFIDLPEGDYRITTISIPVGTTLAAEPMDITFGVEADRIVYLGTLKVVGTKQRVRLGGVPIIKPGFEYQVQMTDDSEEADTELRRRFPELKDKIESRLFNVRLPANDVEAPSLGQTEK